MFAAFTVEHVVVAMYIAQGIGEKSQALNGNWGADWGAGALWFAAVVYFVVSVWLGCLGWRAPRPAPDAHAPR
ncbi:hypothetical protein C731_2741 [Mycolicibacterium hassiacum DSM 44199]|uniref:Uncharacterized protein n=2 Tax=Mycolicibacterium hassiacum TaxID=46351 RepID=K5BES8_MYCHD|nr:hypothetical protein C731_2741 [Mycolicibacterium hassiacum DSM 44199]MBX5487691.1 hypothetical protein [Mycolicibacterium hassiacum]MDA4086460.1 hypothetical protein [Mycolicibacterium hassiacum DSM 44199]PZN21723.1 MAG: hypothetical protein DIU75_09475 [Mycolicibacterium hassiacum]